MQSYCTTEYADEYFAGRLHAEVWEQADESTKEKALRQATRSIDRMRREQARKQQQTEQKAIPAWEDMTYNELKAAAKEAGIKGYGKMSKEELIETLKAGE